MRTILIRYLVVLALFMVAAIAMDYWNFPLSPINYLNRLYAIDLAVRIPEMPAEQLQECLIAEGGAELSLRDAAGNELERRNTDDKGRVRLYLRGGSYLVLAGLAGGKAGEVVFYETRGPLGLEVDGRKLVGIVELVPSARVDALRLVSYIEKLLSRGDLDRALALCRQITGKRLAGYEQVAARLGYLRQQLDEGLVQIRTLQQLGPASYNSSIVVLGRLEQIVAGLSGKGDELTVHLGEERFNPSRRKRSMEEARDGILASKLGVAEQALRARSFIEALVEFHAALSDPELWRAGQTAPEPTQSRIAAFESARPELVDRVQMQLMEKLTTSVESYERGDLDEAQSGFARVVRSLRALKGEIDMPDSERTAETYLSDLQAIAKARVLEKDERWMEVLDAYTAVTNVNAAVRQGIIEARSRQGQGYTAPAPRPLSPQPASTPIPGDL